MERSGSCNRCGECCHNKRFRPETWDPVKGQCTYYDPASKDCLIYDKRPDYCRDFPKTRWHLRGNPSCGYRWD